MSDRDAAVTGARRGAPVESRGARNRARVAVDKPIQEIRSMCEYAVVMRRQKRGQRPVWLLRVGDGMADQKAS